MNAHKQKKEQADAELKDNDNTVSDGQKQDSAEICFDKAEIAAMMLALDEKNSQLDEVGNQLLRLQADFDNFRRRTRQEKEELSQVVTSGIVTQLLPVLDNFERALTTAPGQDAGQLLAGLELVSRQFTQILERFGIKPIVALGAQFDPALHEAVMRVEDAGQPDGLVVGELQKGYSAHSKVLRPSMVKVINNS
jgi:molecular chaperone GrpE